MQISADVQGLRESPGPAVTPNAFAETDVLVAVAEAQEIFMAAAVMSCLGEMAVADVVPVTRADPRSASEIAAGVEGPVILLDTDVAAELYTDAIVNAVMTRVEHRWRDMPAVANPTLVVIAAMSCRGFSFSHLTVSWPGFEIRTFASVWRIAEAVSVSVTISKFSRALAGRTGLGYLRAMGVDIGRSSEDSARLLEDHPALQELSDRLNLRSPAMPRPEFSSMSGLLGRCRRSRRL